MRAVLISAAMLSVVHVTVPVTAAAAPAVQMGRPAPDGEGVDGGRGVTLARAGAASFLGAPDARQSPLVAVGEGGEGGRGRGRGRRWRHRHGYYVVPAPPPPPVYYVAPPPPPPRVYVPPPPRPSVGVWIDLGR